MANLQGHNEPVAWKCANCGNTSDCQGVGQGDNWCNSCAICGEMKPLYAAPPAAPAVPLTDEQIRSMWLSSEFRGNGGQVDWFCEGIRAAEARHGITGGKP